MKLIIENGTPAKRAILLEIWRRTQNYAQTASILKLHYGIIIRIETLKDTQYKQS